MGGGALSSNVSKLGSKEVSKKLRNFSFAIKKACHCEDERSEDVAIAKSLNINEITTSHFTNAPRNDKLRHPELVSGSYQITNLAYIYFFWYFWQQKYRKTARLQLRDLFW